MTDSRLRALIQDLGWGGILLVGESGDHPDLCRLTQGHHLGLVLGLLDQEGKPNLVYFTDMEREEAAATGVSNWGPQELDLNSLRRETRSQGELLGRAAVRLLRKLQIPPGTIGLGGALDAGGILDLVRVLAARGWQLASATQTLRSWRRAKTTDEVKEARRMGGIVAGAFHKLAQQLTSVESDSTELTVGDLRRTIAHHFADHGVDQPHGSIVAVGSASAVPHTTGNNQDRIRPGETMVVDLFPRGTQYADCSRTFCLPPIPEAVIRAHSMVLQALQGSTEEATIDASINTVVDRALDPIEDAGYLTQRIDRRTRRGMVHSLGHGLGYQLHELPNLRSGSKGRLKEGDVITIEPGLYDPEAGWGIRLEDMLVVGQERCENLTPLPYHLDPGSWA